jgi:hypothetical protein
MFFRQAGVLICFPDKFNRNGFRFQNPDLSSAARNSGRERSPGHRKPWKLRNKSNVRSDLNVPEKVMPTETYRRIEWVP